MPERRFGKRPPRLDYRTLRLASYLAPTLPAPPPALDLLPRVEQHTGVNDVSTLFGMDGNDNLGDCVAAAIAHAETMYHGLAAVGPADVMTAAAVEAFYNQQTGGQDSGLVMLDTLNYWRQHQVGFDQILAYVAIDPRNHQLVQQALELFGGVAIGFQVQQDCIADFDAGRPWTPGPLTQDGHCVFVTGYDTSTVKVLTWGATQRGTWAWWDECVDECYAILSAESGQIDGLDLAHLEADLAALGKTSPLPPLPTPPGPTPPPPVVDQRVRQAAAYVHQADALLHAREPGPVVRPPSPALVTQAAAEVQQADALLAAVIAGH